MAFKVNGTEIINESLEVSNITATAAQAAAATVANKVMTPLGVKQAIEGGNISVIKSVQRFSLDMGEYTWPDNGQTYFTWGSSSNSTGFSFDAPSGSMSVQSDGVVATYCFVNLAQAVNLRKSFINLSFSGAPGHDGCMARLYNSGGYSGSSVQIKTSDWIPKSDFFLQSNQEPNITCEIIEYN